MRRILPAVIFAVMMLLMPQTAFAGAQEGLTLWFQNVLPAQFPFMVCILFLMKSGVASGGASAPALFLTGMLSGYPGGAKAVQVLYRQGRISPSRLQWLMTFCNNSGPLFIVGTVGIGLFHSVEIGYILLAAHLLSAALTGWLYSFRGTGEIFHLTGKGTSIEKRPFGALLGECVAETSSVLISVGGFMMIYCVLIRMGTLIFPAGHYFYGILEMTNGVAQLTQLPLWLSVPLSGALISMGGLSVYSQTCAVMYDTSFSGPGHLLAKCVQGLICGILLFVWAFTVGFA